MEQRQFGSYLIRSLHTQIGIWLAENSNFPEIRIAISGYLRDQLRSECIDVYADDDSQQETFCGYPLILDKNLPDNKFEIHFLTCNQVRMRVTLTG